MRMLELSQNMTLSKPTGDVQRVLVKASLSADPGVRVTSISPCLLGKGHKSLTVDCIELVQQQVLRVLKDQRLEPRRPHLFLQPVDRGCDSAGLQQAVQSDAVDVLGRPSCYGAVS